jgi:hypothetical protein
MNGRNIYSKTFQNLGLFDETYNNNISSGMYFLNIQNGKKWLKNNKKINIMKLSLYLWSYLNKVVLNLVNDFNPKTVATL